MAFTNGNVMVVPGFIVDGEDYLSAGARATMRVPRVTVVPRYNVAEFAKEAATLTVVPPPSAPPSFASLSIVPVEWNSATVPVCVAAPDVFDGSVEHRSAFVLLHVDGSSTVKDIARSTDVAEDEILVILASMAERGFISIRRTTPPPVSGIRELTSFASA